MLETIFAIWLMVFIVCTLGWIIGLGIEVAWFAEHQTSKDAESVKKILRHWWWPILWPVIAVQYGYLFFVYLRDAVRKSS